MHNKLLSEQLAETKSTSETLTKILEETQNQNKVFEDDCNFKYIR